MRVTFLGHAGMFVETEGGIGPVRPVVQPGVLRLVVPVPAQRHASIRVAVRRARTTSTSRTCTTTTSTRSGSRTHVDRAATVLLPGVPSSTTSSDALRGPRLHRVRAHRARRSRCQLPGGLQVAILAMTAPADGPAGDSALVLARLDRGDPQPERRPAARPRTSSRRSVRSTRTSPSSPARSGTRWSTTSRPRRSGALGIRKRADQMERAMHYVARRRRAGTSSRSPVRRASSTTTCSRSTTSTAIPANIFPDQTVVPRRDGSARASRAASCSCRARSRRSRDGGVHDRAAGGRRAPGRDLRRRARVPRALPRRLGATGSSAEQASWPRDRIDVVAELRDVVGAAARRRAADARRGVGGAVLLHVGDVGVLIDFPAGDGARVGGRAGGVPHRRRPRARRVAASSATSRTGSTSCSCRAGSGRTARVSTTSTSTRSSSASRSSGWRTARATTRALAEPSDEMFRCGDYLVQKRCPHLRADLERFGSVDRRRARVQGAPLAVRPRDRALPHVRRRRAPCCAPIRIAE